MAPTTGRRVVRKKAATATTTPTSPASSPTTTKKASEPVLQNKVAEVPDKSYFTTYKPRKINGHVDLDLLAYALATKSNVLIEGPTGTGKTSLAMAFAAKHNMPFYSISSNAASDPSQFLGRHVPDENGNFPWQDGPATDIVRHGGVLLLNEIGFMPDRIKSALFGLLDKRRKIELVDHKGEVITAGDNVLIIADNNPDYEGVRPLNKAFRNRFAVQMFFDYDPNIESKLVQSKQLLELAKKMREQITAGLFETPVSTNMLMEFEQVGVALSVEFAIENFVNHFALDEQAAVRQAVKTYEANLKRDIAAIIVRQTGEVEKPGDNDWGTGENWSSQGYTFDPNDFFSDAELKGKSRAEMIEAGKGTGMSISALRAMDDNELREFLKGNHDWWKN